MTDTDLRYHDRTQPIPAGWRLVGPAPGHHAERYVILVREPRA